jgi:hypothetical protein
MDASKNEVEDLIIKNLPTMRLYTKENKQGIDYSGADIGLEAF